MKLVQGTCHVTIAHNSHAEGRHSLMFTFWNDTVNCISKSAMEYWAFVPILSHSHQSLVYPNRDKTKHMPKQRPRHRLELCPMQKEVGESLTLQTVGFQALLLLLSCHVACHSSTAHQKDMWVSVHLIPYGKIPPHPRSIYLTSPSVFSFCLLSPVYLELLSFRPAGYSHSGHENQAHIHPGSMCL